MSEFRNLNSVTELQEITDNLKSVILENGITKKLDISKIINAVLPVVSNIDDGKILKVEDGEWTKGDAPSGLPEVTIEDNGKVLGVAEGEWQVVTPSGGDGGFVIYEATPMDPVAEVAHYENLAELDLTDINTGDIVTVKSDETHEDSPVSFYKFIESDPVTDPKSGTWEYINSGAPNPEESFPYMEDILNLDITADTIKEIVNDYNDGKDVAIEVLNPEPGGETPFRSYTRTTPTLMSFEGDIDEHHVNYCFLLGESITTIMSGGLNKAQMFYMFQEISNPATGEVISSTLQGLWGLFEEQHLPIADVNDISLELTPTLSINTNNSIWQVGPPPTLNIDVSPGELPSGVTTPDYWISGTEGALEGLYENNIKDICNYYLNKIPVCINVVVFEQNIRLALNVDSVSVSGSSSGTVPYESVEIHANGFFGENRLANLTRLEAFITYSDSEGIIAIAGQFPYTPQQSSGFVVNFSADGSSLVGDKTYQELINAVNSGVSIEDVKFVNQAQGGVLPIITSSLSGSTITINALGIKTGTTPELWTATTSSSQTSGYITLS